MVNSTEQVIFVFWLANARALSNIVYSLSTGIINIMMAIYIVVILYFFNHFYII